MISWDLEVRSMRCSVCATQYQMIAVVRSHTGALASIIGSRAVATYRGESGLYVLPTRVVLDRIDT